MKAMLQTQAKPAAKVSFAPVQTGTLQRKCACGTPGPAGECEECTKNREAAGHLQTKLAVGRSGDGFEEEADRAAEAVTSGRAASTLSPITDHEWAQARDAGTAPPIVNDVLNSAGQPLDSATRETMGQRFGYDFSRVRIHTDAKANESARAVSAHAYTVREHLAFDAGRYSPSTHAGQKLLAHELSHVVQQRAAPGLVQRAINVEDFEGGNFTMDVLETYLAKFGPGKIEDHNDSDDKARTIVALWRKGKIKLDARKKILLIQEMQSGFTGDDDERAILTLLLNTTDGELQTIFGKGGIDPNDLDSDFQGPEEDVLRAFYDRKCEGGRAAALKGSCKLRDTGAGQQAAPKAQQAPARVPRKNETDVVVLLDATLDPVAKTVAADAVTLQPANPEELGKKLKALNRPIKTIFYFGHADNTAAIKFGKGWFTADKHAAGVAGMVPPGMEPELVDFRGCRIGMTPPAMEKIRVGLGAKVAIGGTCWLVTKINGPFNFQDGQGDVTTPAKAKRYTDARLASGLKMLLDSFGSARKCVLDTTLASYFRAGGKLVSAWFTPVRSITEFEPLYSRCYNSLEPKVVDPAVVTQAQASTSHECQLIKVEEKPKAEAKP